MIRDTSPALQAPSPERTYLAVPYAEKDDAKQLGATWDLAEKAWYVPAVMDLEAFTPWMLAKGSVHIAADVNPVEQFAEALRESGLQRGRRLQDVSGKASNTCLESHLTRPSHSGADGRATG